MFGSFVYDRADVVVVVTTGIVEVGEGCVVVVGDVATGRTLIVTTDGVCNFSVCAILIVGNDVAYGPPWRRTLTLDPFTVT